MLDNVTDISPQGIKNNTFKWRIHTWCNYRCEYCVQGLQKDKAIDKDTLFYRAAKVKEILNDSPKKVNLSLIGGEICCLDLCSVFNALYNEKIEGLHVVTNLSASADYWKKLNNACKEKNIHLHIYSSFHYTQVSFDKFINKIKELSDNGIHIKWSFVVFDDNLKQAESWVEKARSLNVPLPQIKYKREHSGEILVSDAVRDFVKANTDPEGCDITVTYDDDTKVTVRGATELKSLAEQLNTKGMFCTHHHVQLNLNEKGELQQGNGRCFPRIPLENYTPDIWNPMIIKCERDFCGYCNYPHIWRQQ